MGESLHKAGSEMNFRNARRMRKVATDAEAVLWEIIRGRKLGGFKFRRQHPFGAYIADFYCHELKLVIELDGGYHNTEEQKAKDELRDKELLEKSIHTLRLTNESLLHNTENCINNILNTLNELRQNIANE